MVPKGFPTCDDTRLLRGGLAMGARMFSFFKQRDHRVAMFENTMQMYGSICQWLDHTFPDDFVDRREVAYFSFTFVDMISEAFQKGATREAMKKQRQDVLFKVVSKALEDRGGVDDPKNSMRDFFRRTEEYARLITPCLASELEGRYVTTLLMHLYESATNTSARGKMLVLSTQGTIDLMKLMAVTMRSTIDSVKSS
jgi:hypothetical protein